MASFYIERGYGRIDLRLIWNAISAVGTLAAAAVGGWAAMEARRSATASERTAKASANQIVELKNQREAVISPVIALDLKERPSPIIWQLGGNRTIPPAMLEIANFGDGPAIEVAVEYTLKSQRSDFERAAQYISCALRKHNMTVRMSEGFFTEVTSSDFQVGSHGLPASLKATSFLQYLASHERAIIDIPEKLIRGIFLIAVDSWSESANQPPRPDKEVSAIINIEVTCRSASGIIHEFSKLIDLELTLQTRFSSIDEEGWRFPVAGDPFIAGTVEPTLEVFLSWSLRRRGKNSPNVEDKIAARFSSEFSRVISIGSLENLETAKGAGPSPDPPPCVTT